MKSKVYFLFLKLGQDSVFDVIRYDYIEGFIATNIISIKYELYNNVESAITFLLSNVIIYVWLKHQLVD